MRAILKPAILTLGLAAAAGGVAVPGLAAAQSAPAAPQTPTADAADAQVRQIPLTQALVDQFIAAKKDVDAILDKLPDGADQPDPASMAKLDSTAKKYMFTDYKQYDTVESNIGMTMAGMDPDTKNYIGPEAVVRKQISQVEADKQMSAKDKKDAVDQLNAALPTIPQQQFPANAEVVTKNFDKLNAAMPQD